MNLSTLPILGPLLAQGKASIDAQVQAVTSKVYQFKLLPEKMAAIKRRLSLVQQAPSVLSNVALSQQVSGLQSEMASIASEYAGVDASLDVLLDKYSAAKATGNTSVDVTMLSMAATVLNGMPRIFDRVKAGEDRVAQLESRAGFPAPAGANKGVYPTVGFALLGLSVVVFLVVRHNGPARSRSYR